MPQFNDTELTAAVIKSFEETPDPRVKFLMEELVKSLHDFVRKTDLSFDEWGYAIDFLTRVGQKCSAGRQEFILLSDVLGVSMLVDAVNHREREGATETTVLGPFYLRKSHRRADVRAEPRHRPQGQAPGRRCRGRLARRR
jgi:hydroxyquinol 1,2-dioxygenase